MFKRIKIFLMAGAAMVVSSMASDLQAATVTCFNKKGDEVVYSATTADQSTAFCSPGNLSTRSDITFEGATFGLGINENGAAVSDRLLGWSTAPSANKGTTAPQAWGITLASDWVGTILLELKQSTSYVLFDVTESCDFTANSCSGTWQTAFKSNSTNDLSHARAWVRDGEVPPVPLPAAGFLLFAAVFGLGCLRRRVA